MTNIFATRPPSTLTIEPTAAIVSPSVKPSPAQEMRAIATYPKSSQAHVQKAIATPKMPHQKQHRRPRSDGGAKQRAISIWEALQQWNQLHTDNTFALTPALLEVTFHIHRVAAHEFINEYKNQIDKYHNAIGVGTVRTHNRGKDIQPLKAFVEQHS